MKTILFYSVQNFVKMYYKDYLDSADCLNMSEISEAYIDEYKIDEFQEEHVYEYVAVIAETLKINR